MKKHNEYWCVKYWARVLPDENDNCSLCGNQLYSLTANEARELLVQFENKAIERTLEKDWKIFDWLNEDEKQTFEEVEAVLDEKSN